MLHFLGTRQAPRKYPVPEAPIVNATPKDLCGNCYTLVWNERLFSILASTHIEQETVSTTYKVTSHDIRQSTLIGCGFCRTLADGINGSVYLNEHYDMFRQTQDSSESEQSANERHVEVQSMEDYEVFAGTDNDWNDADAFNADEGSDSSMSDAWDFWQDRDTLVDECDLKITLFFVRGDAGLFTVMNAHIEVAAIIGVQSADLCKLQGKRAVELRYYIHTDGRCTTSTILMELTMRSTRLP